ncbi:MAG: putative Ig domain-containing protein [Candidatus Hodarchaeales archaeon]
MKKLSTTVLFLIGLLICSTAEGFELIGQITGENDGDQYGSAICNLDFNGDGYIDLAVSAPANDDAGISAGKVYLYYGGPDADTVVDHTLTGDVSSFFGKSLSSAGDFNNDGYEDLLVGAPFYDIPATSAGAVYLFYGGPATDAVVDHIFNGENGGDYFGIAVSSTGDINNDGYDDFAVGAYYNDWGSFTKAGKVYVYYGSSSPDFSPDLILVGSANGERFGFSISSQDYNGDSYSDIAVGAYSYDDALINQGRIYVFKGGNSIDSIPDYIITGDSAGYKFGWSLASGKVNADNYYDLIMGSDGVSIDTFSVGGVFVFNGGIGFNNLFDYSFNLGRSEHDYLGFDISSSADINGDGYDDILAGMPGNDDGGTDAGGLVLLNGGTTISVDTSFLGTSSGMELGKAVGFWRDYGSESSIVIAAGASSSDAYRGKLILYLHAGDVQNASPILDPIGSKSSVAEALLSFAVSATDPDGTIPALSAFNLPSGAAFTDNDDGTGLFAWTTTMSDIGTYNIIFVASDGNLEDSETVVITVLDTSSCCILRGDMDHSGGDLIDISDLTYLVDYLFGGGPPPVCPDEGDVNASGGDVPVNISDLTYIVDYLFRGGPAPASCQ